MKQKLIRCDEDVHQELKLYSVKQKSRTLSDSIKELLEGITNE